MSTNPITQEDRPNNLFKKKQLRKVLRYLLMFTAVFIVSHYAPECKISDKTAFIMGAIAAIVFACIDMWFPILCY